MLSTVLDNLADLYETQEDHLRAKEMHENSLDVKKQLMEELDTIESKDDFSAACDSLGFFCDYYDIDLEKAKYYYRQGIEVSKELMKLLAAVIMGESIPMPKLKPWEPCFLGVPDEEEATRRYLDNYNRVRKMSSALAKLEGKQEEPEPFSDEAFSEELYESNYLMTKRPLTLSPTPENKSAHITACEMLANHLQNKGDYERAKEIYQYAFTISKGLMREMDTPMSKYAFAEFCLRMGVFFHKTGADAEAKDVLQQGYSMMKDLLKDKKSSRFDAYFIEYCERLCEFFKDMKASEKEEATYMDAFETMKKHVEKSDTIQSKNAFADLCLCIFYFFKEKGDLIRSEKYCRMYYDIKKQLMEQLGTPKSQRDFASACEILGVFLEEKGDVVQPIELYRRSLGARKNILGTSLRPDETFRYTMDCRSIAAILGEDGAPEMKAHYDYGYTTAKKNLEKKKSLRSKQEFRMVASSYAFFLSKIGEHVEAEKIAEECYLQAKELAEGSNDRRNTMNLIVACYLFAGELAENGNTQKAGEIYLVCLKAMMRLLDTPLDDEETFIIRNDLGIVADFYNDIGESRYDHLALIVGITYTLDKKFDNLVDLIKNLFALTSPAEVDAKIAELLKRYEELKADPNY